MNISEYISVLDDFIPIGDEMMKHINSLNTALHHNASQPNKQPVQEHLDLLSGIIEEFPLARYSQQQFQVLEHIGVALCLGELGKEFFSRTVEQSGFDPATASQHMAKVRGKFEEGLQLAKDSLRLIGQSIPSNFRERTIAEGVEFRVGFKDSSSINNIVDLKRWSADWHDVMRGVSLVVGEAPENVRVVGAATGSIWVYLSGTLAATKILAIISDHVARISLNVIAVLSAIEDLKARRILTSATEKAMRQNADEIGESALEEIVKEVRSIVGPSWQEEFEGPLRNSIEKLIKFQDGGGEIDFVLPDLPEVGGEEENSTMVQELREVKKVVEEARKSLNEVKRIPKD